jgi:HK97 family phage major capsid protein
MSIAKRIEAQRERLVAIKDELTALKAVTEQDDFQSFTDDEQEKISLLTEEEATVIKSIESYEKLEQGLASKAQPVQPQAQNQFVPKGTGGQFQREEKGGDLLVRSAVAKLIAHKKQIPLADVLEMDYFRGDDRVKAALPLYLKTAVAPATTTATGWAAELVDNDLQGFLEDLAPVSIYAALRASSLALEFGSNGTITIPSRAGGRTDLAGAFVGEGGAIPVKRGTLATQVINRFKLAVISTMTNEIMEQSIPSIEALVRRAILEDTAVALDNALLDAAAAVAGVRPASIVNGVTGTASAGDTLANIITDMKVLINSQRAANLGNDPVLIMNDARRLGLAMITNAQGNFVFRDEVAQNRVMGLPIITSTTCPADEVIIVDRSSFAGANGAPEFQISDQATLVMANADDTAPTMAVDASGDALTEEQVSPGGGISVSGGISGTDTAGAEAVSMYQTYSTAIRMTLPTSWAVLRSGAVDRLTSVSW